MVRTKEATGKTVEEARAAACAALGILAALLHLRHPEEEEGQV